MSEEMKIGIIGPSGRNGKISKITKTKYQKMIDNASKKIQELKDATNADEITLVSGGAALSDHIAVELYLKGAANNLILHLPCGWSEKHCNFINDQKSINDFFGGERKLSTSDKANNLHKLFSSHLQKKSLEEIQLAIEKGAQIFVWKGFYARNAKIAKESDILLAFSFGDSVEGGTKNTWDQFNKEKFIITI